LQVTSDIQAATSVTPINQTQTATAISADNSQQLVVDEIQKINEKMLTKSDVANAITHAMPSGDVVLNIDSITFGKISRSSLNKLASSTGSLNLNV
jgi:nitrate reductase alpha subunit